MATETFISCQKTSKGGLFELDHNKKKKELARDFSHEREKLGLTRAPGVISDYGHALFLYALLKKKGLIDGDVWDFPLSDERVSLYLDCDLEAGRRAISILSELGLIVETGQFKDGDEHIGVYEAAGRSRVK